VLELDGRLAGWNSACKQLFHWDKAQIGKLIPGIPDAQRDDFENLLRAHRAGVTTWELQNTWQDQVFGNVVELLLRSKLWHEADNSRLMILVLICDATAALEGERCAGRDRKMQALGNFARSISHDLRNTVRAQAGYTQLLQAELRNSGQHRCLSYLAQIRKAVESVDAVLADLAPPRTLRSPERMDLTAVVENLRKQIQEIGGEKITVSVELKPELWMTAVRTEVEVMILDLVNSAIASMPKGGNLKLKTGGPSFGMGWRMGEFVWLGVWDSGPALDREEVERIFEPFAPGDRSGRGGLSLWRAHDMAVRSGGYMETGALKMPPLRAYFPFGSPASATLCGGTETILAVEDEPNALSMISEFLRTMGYKILVSGSATDALLTVVQRANPIGLLLSDFSLQDGNGDTLAREVLNVMPEVKVLLMSGHEYKSEFPLLLKPFTPKMLSDAVREVLRPSGAD
jgi:signal transduction histidine kinase/CheY-like chemotaxis protein